MKDAQELLRKVDSDLNQKYSPDFKDRYQIELLLRELDPKLDLQALSVEECADQILRYLEHKT